MFKLPLASKSVFLCHKGVVIYFTYKQAFPADYWYSTNPNARWLESPPGTAGDREFLFDVRALPHDFIAGLDLESLPDYRTDHATAIRFAIDAGHDFAAGQHAARQTQETAEQIRAAHDAQTMEAGVDHWIGQICDAAGIAYPELPRDRQQAIADLARFIVDPPF